MKTLVLVFHPNMSESRVNKRLMLEAQKHEADGITVRDEYHCYPDGKIDVNAEQKLLEENSRIVLQFPFYWYSSPSLLKKWEDEVLLHGWAYGTGGTKLHGKQMLLAVSTGAPADDYRFSGTFGYTMDELLSPFKATSIMVGMKFLKPFILNGVMQHLPDSSLEAKSAEYVKYISQA